MSLESLLAKNTKMHQILVRLEHAARPRWELTVHGPPDPLTGFGKKKGRERKGGEEGEGRSGKVGPYKSLPRTLHVVRLALC